MFCTLLSTHLRKVSTFFRIRQVPTMTIKLPQIDNIYYFHKKMFAFLAHMHFFLYLRTSACVNNNSYHISLSSNELFTHSPVATSAPCSLCARTLTFFMKIGFALLCPLYIHHYEQVPTTTIKLPQIDDIYYFS